jgi:hypothetical protein
MIIFKRISKLFGKKRVIRERKSVLDMVSDDQEVIDGCRLAMHDICLRYDCPGMDAMVNEVWRQMCGKLMNRLEGTKF